MRQVDMKQVKDKTDNTITALTHTPNNTNCKDQIQNIKRV
jgi:hypothetical protein